MLVRIANREDPDLTASSKQSDLGLRCLSRSFGQATSVQNFSKFTVCGHKIFAVQNTL